MLCEIHYVMTTWESAAARRIATEPRAQPFGWESAAANRIAADPSAQHLQTPPPAVFVTPLCEIKWKRDELCGDDCKGCKNRPLDPICLEVTNTQTGKGVFAKCSIQAQQIVCLFGDTGVAVLESLKGDPSTRNLMEQLFEMLDDGKHLNAFPYSVECYLPDGTRAFFVPRQDAMNLPGDMQRALEAQGHTSGPDCGHLLNHSCCTCAKSGWNCQLHAMATEDGKLRIAVVAVRLINVGEQLRLCYNTKKGDLPFKCKCCACTGLCTKKLRK